MGNITTQTIPGASTSLIQQYLDSPEKIKALVAQQKRSAAKLKALAAKKPNPNIGQGLKTPRNLPQFGEEGWVNPNYDPYHNANGYHRFDPKIPGMGIQNSKDYAHGARTYDGYQRRSPGKPGYTHAQNSLKFLTDNGINPKRATDLQKFAAMDYAMRLVQWKNQRPKRKFGIKDAFGLALSVGAIFAGGPYLAAGLAAGGSAVQGGDIGDILTAGAIAGIGNYAGGTLGSAQTAGNSVDALFAASAGVKGLSTAAKLANFAKTVGPYVGSAIVTGNAINQSGVNLTPDQNSFFKGGNRKITTFEPENKNIALSAHPSRAYAAAYPGLANVANVANAGTRPINAAPIAPINTSGRNTAPYAAPKPYVAPPRVQIASNIPIINYDPSRNYPQTTTMQQALMRPAATRAPSKNVTAA